MNTAAELAEFRRRFPDPRPRIMAALAEHSRVCTCARCKALYAENVELLASAHRIADLLEKACNSEPSR